MPKIYQNLQFIPPLCCVLAYNQILKKGEKLTMIGFLKYLCLATLSEQGGDFI